MQDKNVNMEAHTQTGQGRKTVRFLLGWDAIEVSVQDTHQTVLQYLRNTARLCGTKEGCAEGDCGACSVMIGEWVDGVVSYRTLNSCILFLTGLDGKQVLTIEHVSVEGLHPVQAAMVEFHGSQCGFCTPGIVMSLVAHHLNQGGLERVDIDDSLAGNLCRCTGYGPIISAAKSAMGKSINSELENCFSRARQQLESWADEDSPLLIVTTDDTYFSPKTQAQLSRFLGVHPGSTIVAGATDVGLWITKHGRRLSSIVSLGAVRDFTGIVETDTHIEIGANVTYAQAEQVFSGLSTSLGGLVRRIGGRQIRNSGTVCGNIANGSPVGDLPPVFMALGSLLTLNSSQGQRSLPIEEYFIAYGEQDRRSGEYVASVKIQKPVGTFRCYKVSKRFDQDISSVLGAFQIEIHAGKVVSARIAFGGMAGIPQRARGCEVALTGAEWNARTIDRAKSALDRDFQPLTDARATQAYRQLVARNLLERFYLEQQSPDLVTQLSDRSAIELFHA